ncbi:GntR family transcriptional regulator [Uliginosibacterium sp. H3]|uniref:GntR family transcriptional regulator n=1 Tax=Uliginosibacterium silvisoli TaxID=3114758 RepID=A0ABU6K5U9_9RHOO|nr:GntR family transcriptional regulator [Uliginosibacterium sp. H3]
MSVASIGAQLHEQLRTAIVTGEIRPGQALSETDIATRYEVSRQPVREAFIRLAQERLVVVLPQRGTFVVKISIRDVMDGRFVREAIEVAVVREAAALDAPARAALVEILRDAIAQQSQVASGDNASFLMLDEHFHHAIAAAVQREHAWRVVDQIKAQMDRVRYLSFDSATPVSRLIAQHREILDAIEAGQPEVAESAMRMHHHEILQSLPELAKRYPEVFED